MDFLSRGGDTDKTSVKIALIKPFVKTNTKIIGKQLRFQPYVNIQTQQAHLKISIFA